MKNGLWILILLCVFTTLQAADPSIRGDYLEVRTSDIYTGPCFANAEVNLTGKEAIMAWRVRSGSWNGVSLHDLSIVAVIRANATLGDPFADPEPTRSVLVIDKRATTEQEAALVDLARSMSGDLLHNVARVQQDDIEIEIEEAHHPGNHGGVHSAHFGEHPTNAHVRAGAVAEFETRSLHEGDHFCGNETVYYPPLADVEASPAYTKVHWFKGDGLNSTWSSPSKRSAFVGSFVR